MENKQIQQEIVNILEKIRYSITTSEEQKKKWTTRSSFLFKQKDRLNNILDFSGNELLLNAYLTIQGFKYLENKRVSVEFLVDKIKLEVEMTENEIEKDDNREFMRLLIERINRGDVNWRIIEKLRKDHLAKGKVSEEDLKFQPSNEKLLEIVSSRVKLGVVKEEEKQEIIRELLKDEELKD